MKRFALALDLIDDPDKIKAYEDWHKIVWPEILDSIADSGITLAPARSIHARASRRGSEEPAKLSRSDPDK